MEAGELSDQSVFAGMTEKQRRIYESALEVFAEKGFSGSSTGEIARKAGVAEGLIFKHFKNKRQLFQKIGFMVIEKTLIPLTVKRTEKIFEENFTDIRVFLNIFFNERLDFISKHQSFIRIIFQEISFDPDLQKFARSQFESRLLPSVQAFIERHQRAGVIKPLDSAKIIRMVISSFISYAVLRHILFPSDDWDDNHEIRATIDILCDGLSVR